MYCRNCGSKLDANATFCNNCGSNQNIIIPQNRNVVDEGGFGWGLLGCCIPVAGLILFLVWNDSKPKTAKAAGIGALINVLSIVLFYALIFILAILESYP